MSILPRVIRGPGPLGAAPADSKSHSSSKVSSLVKAVFVSSIPALFLLKLEGTRSMAPWAFVPLFIFTYISSEREQKSHQLQIDSINREHQRQMHIKNQQLFLETKRKNSNFSLFSMCSENLSKTADALHAVLQLIIDFYEPKVQLNEKKLQLVIAIAEYKSTPESDAEKREGLKTRVRELRHETISLSQQIYLKSALKKIYTLFQIAERDLNNCKSILRGNMDEIQAIRKLWDKFIQHRHELTPSQAQQVNTRVHQLCKNIESSFQFIRDHLKSTDAMLEEVEQSIPIFISKTEDENSNQEFKETLTRIQQFRQEILLLSTAIGEQGRSNLELIPAQVEQ